MKVLYVKYVSPKKKRACKYACEYAVVKTKKSIVQSMQVKYMQANQHAISLSHCSLFLIVLSYLFYVLIVSALLFTCEFNQLFSVSSFAEN